MKGGTRVQSVDLHDFQEALVHEFEAHSPTRCPSPQELLQLTASVAAGANDMSIEESLSETLTLCCKTWASVLSVRAWWSQSAGWTELWSFGGTEPSFRCRSGWPTWRAACNPAQRNVWEINPSRSSSARSGPSHTQSKVKFSICEVEDLILRDMFGNLCVWTHLAVEETVQDGDN